MRLLPPLAFLLSLSTPVAAHPGPHQPMSLQEMIVHLLSQHHAPALIVLLVLALLIAWSVGQDSGNP